MRRKMFREPKTLDGAQPDNQTKKGRNTNEIFYQAIGTFDRADYVHGDRIG